MTLAELKRALEALDVRAGACVIEPPLVVEGALCLMRTTDGRWRVALNERGEYRVDEVFETEDRASRYFLRRVISDPTYLREFKQSDLLTHRERIPDLLRRFGLES